MAKVFLNIIQRCTRQNYKRRCVMDEVYICMHAASHVYDSIAVMFLFVIKGHQQVERVGVKHNVVQMDIAFLSLCNCNHTHGIILEIIIISWMCTSLGFKIMIFPSYKTRAGYRHEVCSHSKIVTTTYCSIVRIVIAMYYRFTGRETMCTYRGGGRPSEVGLPRTICACANS